MINTTKSQNYWGLVWWRFRQNRLAVAGLAVLAVFYGACVFLPEFFAPYGKMSESGYYEARPQRVRFIDQQGKFHFRPFVYGLEKRVDRRLNKRYYAEDPKRIYPLFFWVTGEPYRLLGLLPGHRHLFGTDPRQPEAHAFLFGTDPLGRDVFSRIIYGGRLSLLIGLIGQILTLLLGTGLGTISGYFGRKIDLAIQRTTEFLSAFPDIPLFMALAAAIPPQWSSLRVYFILTLILALVRWGGLARQVRSIVLSLRESEYVLAARSYGASHFRIIFRHLIPGTLSHVIVIATLAVPSMILAETALSWLGLGLRPPEVSWGVLLHEVKSLSAIRFAPWYLLPVPFVITVILAFNLLGDGLRDALDPYGKR